MPRVNFYIWIACVFFLIVSCAKVEYYEADKRLISERLGLYLHDVEVLSHSLGENKETIFLRSAPYRVITDKEIADALSWQLEAKGFKQRCRNYNELPIFGGPFYRVGLSTSYGLAVIITVKPQREVDVHMVQIEYIKDMPILPC
ncbi:MAG: hypothetical protein ACK4OF_06205 [Aquificaceae bacterium]